MFLFINSYNSELHENSIRYHIVICKVLKRNKSKNSEVKYCLKCGRVLFLNYNSMSWLTLVELDVVLSYFVFRDAFLLTAVVNSDYFKYYSFLLPVYSDHQLLKHPNQPVWYQQPCCDQSHYDHIFPILTYITINCRAVVVFKECLRL